MKREIKLKIADKRISCRSCKITIKVGEDYLEYKKEEKIENYCKNCFYNY
jgi:hypothetical protein